MFLKRVKEDEAHMLLDVKAALLELKYQEVVVPEDEMEAAAANELKTLEPVDKDAEAIPQVEELTQWVTVTTRYGRSSRLPSR